MSDKDEVIACYQAMYEGECRKDTAYMAGYLDESFVLVHMTGVRMNREEFFDAIKDGTLNYYRFEHEAMNVNVSGNKARLTGDTRVEAAVYGGGKHVWPLRLVCDLVRKVKGWKMTKAVASTY